MVIPHCKCVSQSGNFFACIKVAFVATSGHEAVNLPQIQQSQRRRFRGFDWLQQIYD